MWKLGLQFSVVWWWTSHIDISVSYSLLWRHSCMEGHYNTKVTWYTLIYPENPWKSSYNSRSLGNNSRSAKPILSNGRGTLGYIYVCVCVYLYAHLCIYLHVYIYIIWIRVHVQLGAGHVNCPGCHNFQRACLLKTCLNRGSKRKKNCHPRIPCYFWENAGNDIMWV